MLLPSPPPLLVSVGAARCAGSGMGAGCGKLAAYQEANTAGHCHTAHHPHATSQPLYSCSHTPSLPSAEFLTSCNTIMHPLYESSAIASRQAHMTGFKVKTLFDVNSPSAEDIQTARIVWRYADVLKQQLQMLSQLESRSASSRWEESDSVVAASRTQSPSGRRR